MIRRDDEDLPPLRGKLETEVREEIDFYLQQRAREFEARGMDPEAARRAAHAAFGDPERVAETIRKERRQERKERGGMFADTVGWDLKVVVRGLRRRPTFTAVVVLTLGLGIGAVTAVFSVVNASLLRALPFDDASELVFLQGAFVAPDGPQVRGASPAEVRDWGALSRSFEGVAAFGGNGYTLTGGDGDAERINGETVDAGYFEMLHIEPVIGRTFAASEYEVGSAERPALVGEALWTRRYSRDGGLVGRTITLNGAPYTVVGVLPQEFRGMSLQADVWVPLASGLDAAAMAARGTRWLGAVARLQPGVTLESAQSDMDRVAALLAQQYPEANQSRVALVNPIRQVFMGSTQTLVLVIFAATGVLLLITAVNVTNLLLVRAWASQPETVMRRALGAGRPRLAAHFLTEAVLLCTGGALVGLLIGSWGAGALARAMPPSLLPPYVSVSPDGRVFALVAVLMSLFALITGIVPGYLSARSDLSAGMRERGTVGVRGRSRMQGLLVAGEVALALVLLVGAGLMTRSLGAQLAVDPGFDAEHLLAFRVELPASRYPDVESDRVALTELVSRLRAGPGVSGVALSSDAPLRGFTSAAILFTGDGSEERVRFYRHMVDPAFFETLGVEIERGSAFQGFDAAASGDVAVISRAMAERHFGGMDPVGRTIFVGGNRLALTVIGVAEDVRWRDLTTDLVSGPTDPDVYLPWARFPVGSVELLVRTTGDPAALVPWATGVIRAFDPELPLVNVQPMKDALRIQTAQGRFGSVLLATFSAIAVLLAAVGLYGVLSFAVGRRTREFAVRMAMGARAGQVRRMVVVDGLRLAMYGVVIGAFIAWQASRALTAFLFEVQAGDPATYALTVLLVAVIAALAAWIPAHRATRVEPHTALME